MKALFEQRLQTSVSDFKEAWAPLWARASVPTVSGRPVLDCLINGSLMRPRYLIRLFETARRRSLTFGRNRLDKEDYQVAYKELVD